MEPWGAAASAAPAASVAPAVADWATPPDAGPQELTFGSAERSALLQQARPAAPPVQQQPQKQRQAQGGYMSPGGSDEWTWDDDYNPAVMVRALQGEGTDESRCAGDSCRPSSLQLMEQSKLPGAHGTAFEAANSGLPLFPAALDRASFKDAPHPYSSPTPVRLPVLPPTPPQARATRAAREVVPSPRALLHEARRAAADSEVPTVITQLPHHLGREVLANGVLLVDKPLDWTAEDACNAVKHTVKAKRAAHAGGLGEGATGLVIVLLGEC
jgi:hypothetical protein